MCLEIGDKVAVLDDIIKGEVIAITDNIIGVEAMGMTYQFHKKELVKIEVEQEVLSKFSDINNTMLQDKMFPKQKRKKPLFKKIKKK